MKTLYVDGSLRSNLHETLNDVGDPVLRLPD